MVGKNSSMEEKASLSQQMQRAFADRPSDSSLVHSVRVPIRVHLQGGAQSLQ